MHSSCPCCGEIDGWMFDSGVINGEPIEPGEFTCERCLFVYTEHVKHPMGEAALKFAPIAVENVRRAAVNECAEIVDQFLGPGIVLLNVPQAWATLLKRIRAVAGDEDE